MNDEILKLASKVGLRTVDEPTYIIDFYRAAFNAGLEAAAKVCDECQEHNCACFRKVRALELK